MNKKWAWILLFCIGFFVYIPSLLGSFVWDDEDFVYANQAVTTGNVTQLWSDQSLAGRGKVSNYYRPIQFSLYAFTWRIFGNAPFFFHLLSVLIHSFAAVSAYLFLLSLHFSPLLSFFSALIFLIHPVQTESVSYISGLSDPLYVLFLLLSLRFYILKDKRPLYFILSIFFFTLALFSKEFAVVGILIALWYEVTYKQMKKNISWYILYAGVGITYLLVRFGIMNFQSTTEVWGTASVYANSILIRLGTFTQSFFTYLSLIFFPIFLFMERDYSLQLVQTIQSPWPFLFITFVVILGLFSLKKRGLSVLLFLVFCSSLVPISGIIPLNGIFYEHYLYLPLFFAWTYVLLQIKTIPKQYLLILLGMFVCFFTIRCVLRQYEWIDNERFYRQTLLRAPQSIRIINNLGMALAEKGKDIQALDMYAKVIKLNPSIPNPYHNSGMIYVKQGDLQKAKEQFKKALSVDPNFIFSARELQKLR